MRRFITGTNYCGPGGDGEIIGPVDEACARHDRAYNKSYYRDYFRSQRADKVFLRDLERSHPRGFRQRVTKEFARRYFGLKTTLWDSFDKMLSSNQVGDGVIVGADGQARIIARKRKQSKKGIMKYFKPKSKALTIPVPIAPPGYRGYGVRNSYYSRRPVHFKNIIRGRRYFKKRSYLRNGYRRVRS